MKKTLYVHRPVINWDSIAKWAKEQGFPSTLADDMHVTIAFSREAVDWDGIEPDHAEIVLDGGSGRKMKQLGDQGAVCLGVESPDLAGEWAGFVEKGASWDWPEYQPHITISHQTEGIDLSEIEPYMGKIYLGPQIFKEVGEDRDGDVVEKGVMNKQIATSKILKVDEGLGLVFGFAIICKEGGEDYYDLHNDHIPEDAMLKASLDFSIDSRMAKDMHGEGDHGHDQVGMVPFIFPLTTDIAKSLGIQTDRTGLLIAMKPESPDVLAKFKSGEYSGFSIGGGVTQLEEA